MSILIAIEGIEGVGKTTLANALYEAMRSDFSFCRWLYQTKEPGLTTKCGAVTFNRPGVDLRDIALTNTSLTPGERELLFYIDASQHKRFIENQGGALFLSDRGLWTHLAYMDGYLATGKISHDEAALFRQLILKICKRPDAILYLKGSVALMKERKSTSQKDIIEKNSDAYFEAVSAEFERLASRQDSKVLILDALNSTSQNVETVIAWLKGIFTDEQLQSGNL